MAQTICECGHCETDHNDLFCFGSDNCDCGEFVEYVEQVKKEKNMTNQHRGIAGREGENPLMIQDQSTPFESFKVVIEKMRREKVEGKETVTFKKEDWESLERWHGLMEQEIHGKIPINNPNVLCRLTTCQAGIAPISHAELERKASKVDAVLGVAENVMKFFDRLIAERVVPLKDWWAIESVKIRVNLEDIRRS
jgi:hypothetical protein